MNESREYFALHVQPAEYLDKLIHFQFNRSLSLAII